MTGFRASRRSAAIVSASPGRGGMSLGIMKVVAIEDGPSETDFASSAWLATAR